MADTDPSTLSRESTSRDSAQVPEAGERIEPAALTRSARIAIRVSVLLGGAILMALEILAFRVIDKTFGSALRETSVVIAVFLTAMSLGYYLGGRWIDRWPHVRTMVAVLAAAGLLALAIPWLDTWISPRVFASSIPVALHSTLVTTVLFVIPTVFLATLSPMAVRLLAGTIKRSGSVAGSISAVSTMGSIAGSVATAFILIDLLESVHRTIVLLAMMSLVLATLLMMVRAFDPRALGGRFKTLSVRHRIAFGACVVVLGGLAASAGLSVGSPVSALKPSPRFRMGEVVFERDSAFHHISVVDRERTRLLFFKHQETQSTMSLDDPYEGAAEYTDYFHIPMVLKEDSRAALFIGLGGGSVPKRYARDYPGITVDVVEIDPLVVEVAREFFHFEEGPRLRVFNTDGRAFVKRSDTSYDVIGIDAYTTNTYGSTVPAHLTTREFFLEVADRLTPGGYVVFNVAAPLHTPMSRAISRTLHEVFPRQMVFEGVTGNTVFMATRHEARLKREDVVALANAGLASGRLRLASIADCAGRMVTSPLPVGDIPVLTDDYAPVDTLMRDSRSAFGVGP